MKHIITNQLAKAAKEKGFDEEVLSHYSEEGSLFDNDRLIWTANLEQGISIDEFYLKCNSLKSSGLYENLNIISAPTYNKLIDWIFEKVEQSNPKLIELLIPTLEHWYNLLKDCPLKYEFKGRLLAWFNLNSYYFHVDYSEVANMYDAHFQKGIDGYTNKPVDTPEKAEHNAILMIFKQLTETNE